MWEKEFDEKFLSKNTPSGVAEPYEASRLLEYTKDIKQFFRSVLAVEIAAAEKRGREDGENNTYLLGTEKWMEKGAKAERERILAALKPKLENEYTKGLHRSYNEALSEIRHIITHPKNR